VTFGWEGFSFEHPEDWAPVAISGTRDQGYARIASPGRLILQLRWRGLKRPADADAFLNAYLGKLSKDSRRQEQKFHSERHELGGQTHYQYAGSAYGRGALFQPSDDSRAFVLEVSSSKSDSVEGVLKDALRSFRGATDRDRWSAFGLDVSLPRGLTVTKREFLAGKTRIDWSARSARVVAERWAFADQLLARHDIKDWATAVVGTKVTGLTEEPEGLRLTLGGWGKSLREAIVGYQGERNQLVVVHVDAKHSKWRPEWAWLN